jgi:hypothetical protein
LQSPKDAPAGGIAAVWQAFKAYIAAIPASATRPLHLADDLLDPVLHAAASATLQHYEKAFLASKEWAFYRRIQKAGLLTALSAPPAPVVSLHVDTLSRPQ